MTLVALRRRLRSRSLAAVVGYGVALPATMMGCSGSKDRAAPIGDCAEPGCGFDAGHGGVAGSTGGGSGVGGSAGAGGGQAASGRVRIYDDIAFDATSEFTGAGVVGVTGTRRALGTFETGQWSVAGAESTGTLWADLHATVMGVDTIDTLEVLDGPNADLVFAPKSAFDVIVTGLSSVQSLSPDRAQIVLKFVNGAIQPVAGVVVAQSNAIVAYDAGNSYTDTKGAPFGATQGRGIAVIINYTAPPFPGAPVTIHYAKPNAPAAIPIDLRAASGAVTFRTVIVN